MSCPIRVIEQDEPQVEEDKQIESENRIEAIFAKYKIRDFSEQNSKGVKEPVDEEEIKEKKSNKCSIYMEQESLNAKRSKHESDLREVKDIKGHKDLMAMHSDVEKIMNECLNSQKFSPVDLRPDDEDWREQEEVEMDIDLHNWDNNDYIVQTSQNDEKYSNILDDLEESVRSQKSFSKDSNFLNVKESINKIRLGQSDLFLKERVFSPIHKKEPM
jgi:hypothetical protein